MSLSLAGHLPDYSSGRDSMADGAQDFDARHPFGRAAKVHSQELLGDR